MHHTDKLQCTINISTPASLATEHTLVLDTGSAVSNLPHHNYTQYFSDTPLDPPTHQLVTYTRRRIPVLGCLHTTMRRGDLTASATFFIVNKGTLLLGRNLMAALKICIKGNTVISPLSFYFTCSCVDHKLCMCFLHACAQNFVHKGKIDPTVEPVHQKLQCLPFDIRALGSAELDRLLKAGIIQRKDASPWVSPFLITGWKTGGKRMCTYIREPNKKNIC